MKDIIETVKEKSDTIMKMIEPLINEYVMVRMKLDQLHELTPTMGTKQKKELRKLIQSIQGDILLIIN